ncbi:hypothetical protein JCM10908_000834 [Rhodotorula pacifica]|uniref:uncharacterized protein n=1 Tax=Rhodotorula pacifica TaxID=1495444 RepID=UPI0031816F1F
MSPALRLPASSTESQWFYTPRELAISPSIQAGLTLQQELHGRSRAIKRLWTLRNYQTVHQPVISTAATFLHRFYMRETLQEYDPIIAAVAAFFLACKSEEEPRSIKALVQFLVEAFRDGQRFRVDRISQPQTDLPEFQKLRAKVLQFEEAILRSLCYDLTVRNPHWYAVNAAQQVWSGEEAETGKRIAQVAWAFLNDSLALPLCLLYRPQLIAAAALVLACAQLDQPLPAHPGTLAEQKALHELRIQEAEEGEEPPPFVPRTGWMDLLEVKPEELRAPIKATLGGYNLGIDPFVAAEAKQLAPKVDKLLSALLPPASAAPPTPDEQANSQKLPPAAGETVADPSSSSADVSMVIDPPA